MIIARVSLTEKKIALAGTKPAKPPAISRASIDSSNLGISDVGIYGVEIYDGSTGGGLPGLLDTAFMFETWGGCKRTAHDMEAASEEGSKS